MSAQDNDESQAPPTTDAEATPDQQEPALQALLFETSPYGNVDAIVQHDERSLYFYLHGDVFGTRACWVRNLKEAPYVISQQDLEQGRPPMMPRTHCRSPMGQPLPDLQSLQVVWMEEGNAAALLEADRLIALIPPWSDVDGFHGYAAECVAESPLAWPLMANEQMDRRIENARAFWQSCGRESAHPFAELQPQLMSVYRKVLGNEQQYYSVDGGQFPPGGAALFQNPGKSILLSVGMSFRPQPNVELSVEHPGRRRRVELAIALPGQLSPQQLQPVLQQFSGLIRYPWTSFTWLGHGHELQMDSLRSIFGPESVTAQLVDDEQRSTSISIPMPDFRGDPVRLLWITPGSISSDSS